MILRTPLHLLALVGLLVALGGQTARSQPDQRPAPSATTRQNQLSAARAISGNLAQGPMTLPR
jgi:gamma-glutamyl:cysteine ligase YbdK (ATP-grasp superfamily)